MKFRSLIPFLVVAAPYWLQTLAAAQYTPPFIVPESSKANPGTLGRRAHTNYVLPQFRPLQGGMGIGGGLTPDQLRQFYNLPSVGGSNAIAIVAAYHFPFALHDFNVFSQQYGLPLESSTNIRSSKNKVLQMVLAGGSQPRSDIDWSLEMALDIEVAHALAPNAKIYLVEAASNDLADLQYAVQVAAKLPYVKQVSMSWSAFENDVAFNFGVSPTAFDYIYSRSGVVFVAATGDLPTAFDSVFGAQYPASSKNVIAVGGTSLLVDEAGNLLDEQGWSSGDGGVSFYEPMPDFQAAIGPSIDATIAAENASVDSWLNLFGIQFPYLASTRMRGTPDVCFDADPFSGPDIYCSAYGGGWFPVGGTSVSAPAVAAILNLAGTVRASFPKSSHDALVRIYKGLGSANFRDITNGFLFDSFFNPIQCAPGWDGVTGVGSPFGLSGL